MQKLNQRELDEAMEEAIIDKGLSEANSSYAALSKEVRQTKATGARIIPYRDALEKCLAEVQQPLPAEQVPVLDSLGRILREDIRSPHPIPPFLRSIMDGYAVKSKNIAGASKENPANLRVIADLPAGKNNGKRLGTGEAMRIMTGAPLPEGSDAVVMVEDTECEGNRVKIFREVKKSTNIAFTGEDVKQGQLIVSQGIQIGPAEMGMLSACGRTHVSVSQRPKIGILSTGDELVAPGTTRGISQIYDINGITLFGLANQSGAEAIFMGIAPDRYEELVKIVNRSGDYDILLISGGVSVGDYDIVQDALLQAGIKKVFWKVRIKPGKPLFLGRRFRQLIFGLPGNPVSSMLNFLLFVRPALDKMIARKTIGLRTGEAFVLEERRLKPGRKKFLRARLEEIKGAVGVRILPNQKSGVFHSMLAANALVEVPEQIDWLRKGDKVKIYRLD